MAGSDIAASDIAASYTPNTRSESKCRGRTSQSALALAGGLLVIALSIAPAWAQYWGPPWAYPYYRGHYRGEYPPPPGPPGDEGPMGAPPGYYAPSFTATDVRRRVARLGLHLVAKPKRKDDIYLAEAEDPNGVDYRLVFDAKRGRLIENTKLPPRKKIAAHKPATEVGKQ
jgi:hypothetical protein